MTSQTLTNWTLTDVEMKSKSRRTSNYFRKNSKNKSSFKRAGKVCFAEDLETVHEVPYNYDVYNKPNLDLRLPNIEVHKYTPLVCRDPYAKPSKKKLPDKFADMFISDALKLPVIKFKATDNIAKKTALRNKEMESAGEPLPPKPSNGTRASEKFQVGNTIHFKYSDFILRKLDRSIFERLDVHCEVIVVFEKISTCIYNAVVIWSLTRILN